MAVDARLAAYSCGGSPGLNPVPFESSFEEPVAVRINTGVRRTRKRQRASSASDEVRDAIEVFSCIYVDQLIRGQGKASQAKRLDEGMNRRMRRSESRFQL